MNKFLFSFCVLFFTSCQLGSDNTAVYNSNVRVLVAPFGSGDTVQSSRPIIFPNGGRKACRQRPFRSSDMRTFLRGLGVDKDHLDVLFNEEDTESEAERVPQTVVLTDVADNWLKFGLLIANHNTKVFLVVESLHFTAEGKIRGEQFLHSGNVDHGYCSGEHGDVAPFLYLVPPGKQAAYRPLSDNPFENLTIYLDGFPIIDRTEEPSREFQREIGVTGVTGNFSSAIIEVPIYTVEITLSGYFMLKDGFPLAAFAQRYTFKAGRPPQ